MASRKVRNEVISILRTAVAKHTGIFLRAIEMIAVTNEHMSRIKLVIEQQAAVFCMPNLKDLKTNRNKQMKSTYELSVVQVCCNRLCDFLHYQWKNKYTD